MLAVNVASLILLMCFGVCISVDEKLLFVSGCGANVVEVYSAVYRKF